MKVTAAKNNRFIMLLRLSKCQKLFFKNKVDIPTKLVVLKVHGSTLRNNRKYKKKKEKGKRESYKEKVSYKEKEVNKVTRIKKEVKFKRKRK